MVGDRIHTLNLALQAGRIKSIFPKSDLVFSQDHLRWKYSLTPSSLSGSYIIELIYVRGKQPDVYVINPTLNRFPGKNKLPHVYDTDEQRLCLYYRLGREWRSNMFIADTIIPWTCEWLLHYEIWVATGVWCGGGIHLMPESEKRKIEKEENDNTKR
jgi:hypothetical protein